MPGVYVFVGPYVDCRTPFRAGQRRRKLTKAEQADAVAFNELLRTKTRMEWVRPSGPLLATVFEENEKPELVGTTAADNVERYCGVPTDEHAGAPRWPMMVKVGAIEGYAGAQEWDDFDAETELAWFQQAYVTELDLVHRVFAKPSTLCWGLVTWEA